MEHKETCKQCGRKYLKTKKGRVFCSPDCRVANFRGTKSKWQKVLEVLRDKKTAKLLGFTIEELMGRPYLEWLHPDDRERTRIEAERLANAEEPTLFENRYLCKDGTYKWLLWSSATFPEEQLHYAVARDISSRKKADEDLKRSNTFLDSIVENIPDMVFIKDAKDLRFVRFNRAGEELLGISRDKMIGKTDYDFFPKEEADFFTKKDRVVLEEGKLVNIPEETIHTSKGIRVLHTKKIPILDENRKPLYLLGISEDITDKKKGS